MHRRSLMDRRKFVYSLEAAALSPHFFLLRLVTSAGAYVKEFVHSDFGRTEPSLRSLLQTRVSPLPSALLLSCQPCDLSHSLPRQTEILQLDVTWLFDDIHPAALFCSLRQDEDQPGQSLSWSRLRSLPTATIGPREK